MFDCKACPEKEMRILELKEQIQYLKDQLNPKPVVRTYEMAESAEANNILDGAGKETIDLEQENKENERIQRESDFIFSGNSETAEANT